MEISTFENNNKYYIRYQLNGITYQKRVSFLHYIEIETAEKINEL